MKKRVGWRRGLPLFLCAGAVLGVSWLARAEGIPPEPAMYYAGTLEEDGAPVTGARDIRLTLWNDEFSVDTSNRLCRVIPDTDTMVENGRFRIPLTDDGACTEAVRQNPEVWVEVSVEGADLGRTRIAAVPYAVESESAQNGAPPGSVMAFAGATPPPGWLVCDGSALASADYPELFAAIRTAWGNGTNDGDAATDFNLPDLRGRFLRGLDDGAGVDLEAASRDASALGGNAGDRVGTVQGDGVQPFTFGDGASRRLRYSTSRTTEAPTNGFTEMQDTGIYGANPVYGSTTEPVAVPYQGFGAPRLAPETRPTNAAVVYLIKM